MILYGSEGVAVMLSTRIQEELALKLDWDIGYLILFLGHSRQMTGK
jgi:hypothetical protein